MVTTVGGIKFDTFADISGVLKDIKKVTDGKYQVKVESITPKVDLKELHLLNKTLDTKQKHLHQTRSTFKGNPIRPTVDLREIHQLNQELDKTQNKNLTINVKTISKTTDLDFIEKKIKSKQINKPLINNSDKKISIDYTAIKKPILEGVDKGTTDIGSTFKNGKKLGKQLIRGFKDELQIRSPSRRFIDLITDSVGSGIDTGVNEILNPIQNLGTQLGESLINGFNNLDFDEFRQNLQALQSRLSLFGSNFFSLFNRITVSGSLKFGALAIAGVGAFKLITNAIQTASQAITDLLFNTQKNIESFNQLYSLNLKFKNAGLGEGGAFAAAQSQGISIDAVGSQATITTALRSKLGTEVSAEIAAGLSQGLKKQGITGEALSGSLMAFSQIASKGKLQQEEKLQLAERGVNINQLTESALGMSATQVEQMQQSGKILATEYLPAIVEELNKAGGAAQFPNEELVKAQNNIVAFRSSLGESTLNITRPFLSAFNTIAEQGTIVKGVITGIGASFALMTGIGVVSLGKLLLSIGVVKAGMTSLLGIIKANALAMVGFGATIAGITAGIALLGISITALQKKSIATTGFDEMANKSKAIADSFDKASKSIEKIDRFKGDLGSRLVNFLSFGGLEKRQENQETIAVSDAIAQSNRVFTQSVQSPEELQKTVDSVRATSSRIAALKVQMMELQINQAPREEVQKINREIGNLTTSMLGSKKQITNFITEFENIKKIINADFFDQLPQEAQKSYRKLYKDFKKLIPEFIRLRDEMNAKMIFELKFKLDQNSIESAKLDLQTNLSQLELDITTNSRMGNINAGLEGMQQRRDLMTTSLSDTQAAIASQREELMNLPVELTSQIKELTGKNLLSLSNKELTDALTKLESSTDTVGDDLKAAFETAKQLKQNEADTLQTRKEILDLELKIAAINSSRSLARNNIVSLAPLRGIRNEETNAKLTLANQQAASQMASSAVSIANANIEMNKAAGELAVTRDRIAAINSSLGKFDDETKSSLRSLLSTDNLQSVADSYSSEQLQQIRQGYADEFSNNPLLEEAFRQIEQAVQLSEQSDQLRLAAVQGKAQIADSLRQAYRSYADFMRSVSDQIEDTQAQITQLAQTNDFLRIQNQIAESYAGSTGNARKFGDIISNLVSSIEGIAGEELSLVDEQRANVRSLRDLRIQYAQVALEIEPVKDKFAELAQATDNLTQKFNQGSQDLLTPIDSLMGVNTVKQNQPQNTTGQTNQQTDEPKTNTAHDPRLTKLDTLQTSLSELRANRTIDNREHSQKMPQWLDQIQLGDLNYDRYNGMQSQNEAYFAQEKALIEKIDSLNKDIANNPWLNVDGITAGNSIKELNHDLDYVVPMATNSAIDALENYKNELIAIKSESKDLKFDKIIAEFKNTVLGALTELSDRSLALRRQMEDTNRSIRNLGEQFGAIQIDPVTKAIRDVNEAYDSQLRTLYDQELAIKREFGLGDNFELTGNNTQDLAQISQSLTPDLNNNQLINQALGKVEGNPEAEARITALVADLESGIIGQDALVLELLQSFVENRNQIAQDRATGINIQEAIATEELTNQRANLTGDLRTSEIDFIQSQRFGTGLPGLWGDDKTRELKLEKEILTIQKQKRDTIAQINEARRKGVIASDEERDRLIAQTESLAQQKEEFAKVSSNPWLEQAQTGIVNLKDSLYNALVEGKDVWEELGKTALSILGKLAQQAALTSLSTMNNGKGGSSFWGQLAGAVISSLSDGYSGDYIPNYANGKYDNALTLGMGVQDALTREGHPKAFPAVINADEVVLSAKGGSRSDAAMWKRARSSGAWEAFKSNYQSNMAMLRVDNYANGYNTGDRAIATIAHNQNNSGNRTVTNNYNYNIPYSASDRSGRETERQRIRREKRERQRTSRD